VFLVLYAICIFVFLNNLAMVLVSFPMYINVTHFCLGVVFLFCFAFVCERVCGGYLLLCNIVFISCDSLCLLSVEMGYVLFLLVNYLIAEYLCSVGLHDSLCFRSVVVGFLYN
jgi:hypothetical protein